MSCVAVHLRLRLLYCRPGRNQMTLLYVWLYKTLEVRNGGPSNVTFFHSECKVTSHTDFFSLSLNVIV